MSRDLQKHLTDEEFIGYAFDDLPAELGQAIEKHVSSCEDCSDRLLAYYSQAEPQLLSTDAWQAKYGVLASRIREGVQTVVSARRTARDVKTNGLHIEKVPTLVSLPLQTSYRTSKGNIVDSFYSPCLQHATFYKRAVGYFTSSGLAAAAKGLAAFIKGNGSMQLVASPFLEASDCEAMQKGYEARANVIVKSLIAGLSLGIDDVIKNRLACLAWLIANNRLEVKIAIPQVPAQGIYHEKIGLFQDSVGNQVAFSGSPNETAGGLVNNFESIDVFWSWDDPQNRVAEKCRYFEALWRNETPLLDVIEFPDAARDKLLEYVPATPPTSDPESNATLPTVSIGGDKPRSQFLPREYQVAATEAWRRNNSRGILEMATGTGKTKTALYALEQSLNGGLVSAIVAPYQHLVEQWANECASFGVMNTRCMSANPKWPEEALQMRLSLTTKATRAAALITTYNTFVTERFHEILGRFPQKKVLIADEVHHLGAQNRRIPLNAFEKRLGLSATPSRIFDPSGTAWLLENVGDVVFRFPMDEAIPKYLVPYYYYVHMVRLDEAEQADYQEISVAISRACGQGASLSEEDPAENARLGPLLRRRHEIIGGAKNKIDQLRQVLRDDTWQRGNGLNFSLFYASSSLFDELLKLTSREFGLKVSKFTFEESMAERRQILDDFSQQRIDAIIAKKCLDEGLDIPATRTAFILASSSNPMEFVQRRGRVLRQHPNKSEAVIHDFFVLPAEHYELNEYDRRLIGRELRRALEFSRTAKNHVTCERELLRVQQQYNLLDII